MVSTTRELIETMDAGHVGRPSKVKLADRSILKTYVLLFSAYFAFGALFQVFPPLFAPVIQTFAISQAQASLTMTPFMAPIVLLAIPAGLAVDRYGTGVVGRVAFGFLFVGGVATGLVGTFPLLLVARAVSGIGGGLLLITLLKVIVEQFPWHRRGLALGIFAAGLPAGTGVAFNLLGALGQDVGCRQVGRCSLRVSRTRRARDAVFQISRSARNKCAGPNQSNTLARPRIAQACGRWSPHT